MNKYNDVTVIMTWYGQENHLFNQMQFYNSMAQQYPHLTPRLIVINDGHEKGRDYFREVIKVHRDRFDLTGIDVMKSEIDFCKKHYPKKFNFQAKNIDFDQSYKNYVFTCTDLDFCAKIDRNVDL